VRGPGGHIVERSGSDGRLRYMVKVESDPDPATGRRRQLSAGTFRTKRAAQERLAQVLSQGYEKPAAGTVSEFLLDEWLPTRADRAPATRDQYRWAVGHITARLGAVKLAELRPRHVHELNDGLRSAGLSSRSRQVIGKTLRSALASAVKRGYVARNPADDVPLPPGDRESEIRFWSADEARGFLSSPAVKEDRLFPLWFVALATGLRRGELCALRWSDLDLPAGRLMVRQSVHLDGYTPHLGRPKTKAALRVVGLDDATVALLASLRLQQTDELAAIGAASSLVFSEADGSLIHPQTLALRFRSLTRHAGVSQIGLHGLRHTHATLALEAGVPLKVVSERLGHASVQITADIYQHALEHIQRSAAAIVGALLTEPGVPASSELRTTGRRAPATPPAGGQL